MMFRGFETLPRGHVSLFCREHGCHMVNYLSSCWRSLPPSQARLTEGSLPSQMTYFRSTLRGTLRFANVSAFGAQGRQGDTAPCQAWLVLPGSVFLAALTFSLVGEEKERDWLQAELNVCHPRRDAN